MSEAKVTGFLSINADDESLCKRHVSQSDAGNGYIQDIQLNFLDEPGKNHTAKRAQQNTTLTVLRDVIGPILLTILSFYLRLKRIDQNNNVVWDEAHFGKFGSYYIKHEYYHDVHPPLGKMLIALSEWIAGFDGQFDFSSNGAYPEDVNFKIMRQFNAMFGALCTPVAFFTAKWMEFNYLTVYLIATMVTLEHSYIVLSKFILLDSMLLFFTLTTFACMVKLYALRKQQMTRKWSVWMLLTGLSIGCVCSVKWVGLFITVIVGLYTCLELFKLYCDNGLHRLKYYKHWLIRTINLIVIPFLIYLYCFKIHFVLLYKSGTGDSTTNTLFQVNLEGTQIEASPRDVVYGSELTIRSHGLSPNLLHSHVQLYPDGSGQRQVTGYGFADSNNIWKFEFSRSSGLQLHQNGNLSDRIIPITDGVEVRLRHKNTESSLHSHDVPSHVSRGNFEVSGYGSQSVGDEKDDWIVEIVKQVNSPNPVYANEDPDILHPVSTFFRLRHKVLGCYLASTGLTYPAWGFKQAEIVCKDSWSHRDKSTWWNVEDHWNSYLETADDYIPPKSNFWTDFILTNFAMASSNSALVPDEDKYDSLSSNAWEWPTLHKGLRMCSWAGYTTRYYLMGSPFNTWASTASLIIFPFIILSLLYRWRRQKLHLSEDQIWRVAIQGVFPFISWMSHYLPFVMMGRVTYVHHYVPALYFAILVFGFVVDFALSRVHWIIKYPAYLSLFGSCIYIYNLFAPICQGMNGDKAEYLPLEWLSTWDMAA
ncbi:Pmt6p [Saccharomyces cerevisiae x Saccharomyces kudriavzevii VIN7]|uniref:Dolichyl-phosphate-mannose--protein mannosyltransferase n=1 Tax=Saccharomyces cerevisiae x Saccharomyces kudriavzevii (strain VIN7) TaxID=1095631 RepID=H0GVA9_SACCK|nr:Pmt6p [Saccharomyces cerevisiae x Saccharomyces kudriavzevii VIN7]